MRTEIVATAAVVLVLGAVLAGDEDAGVPAGDVGRVIRDMESPNRETRFEALRTLVKMVRKQPQDDTTVFVPVVPSLVSYVIGGGIGCTDASLALTTILRIGKPAVPAVIEELKSRESRRRAAAIDILTRMGPGNAPVVAAITPLTADPDTHVRRVCFESLGKLGGEAIEAVPALEKARDDPHPHNVIACCTALVLITGRGKPYTDHIAGLLRSDRSGVRSCAATGLGKCRRLAHDCWPQLLKLAKDKATGPRSCAVAALDDIGADNDQVIHTLIEVLKNDPNLQIRRMTASILGRMGPRAKRAVPVLWDSLRPGKGWYVSVVALARIGGAKEAPGLLRALEIEDRSIRITVVRELAALAAGASEAREALRKCLSHPNEEVRNMASAALREIEERPEKPE